MSRSDARWLDDLSEVLAEHGLIVRGAFHPGPRDTKPRVGTLVLVGYAGPAMWEVFSAGPPGGGNPLDDWSRTVLEEVAESLEGAALFPFDGPPYLPFQRWALRAEPVHPSPLGMLIHPVYGLWHGYRGALAFNRILELPPRDPRASPCDNCADRPCLATCPVSAFNESGYDVASCADHLRSAEGADCMTSACAARRACPVGRDYAHSPEQAAFHMRAFLQAR